MSKNTSTPATVATFPSVEDYRAADVAGKAAIRRDVDKAFRAFIAAGDLVSGQAAMSALDGYKAAGSVRPTVEVDWTALAKVRFATLSIAAYRIASGNFEGAPEGFTLSDEDIRDAKATAEIDEAEIASLTKVRRSTKRDLNSLVADVFANVEKGTFMKASEIVSAVAAIGDGYVPSSGAVVAALSSKKGVASVTYVPADKAKGVKAGGRKA